jgi:hypothetical protein
MLHYQSCTWLCLDCRQPFTYGLSDQGPWALEKDVVSCPSCDAEIALTLTVESPPDGMGAIAGACRVGFRLNKKGTAT